MTACSSCGTENAPDATECRLCGTPISPAPAETPEPALGRTLELPKDDVQPRDVSKLGQTLALATPSEVEPPVATAGVAEGVDAAEPSGSTTEIAPPLPLGNTQALGTPAVESPGERPGPLGQTLVLSPPPADNAATPLGQTVALPKAISQTLPLSETRPPDRAAGLRATVVGLGTPMPPEQAPNPGATGSPQATLAARNPHSRTMVGIAPELPPGAQASGAASPEVAQRNKTILGVARPGIAPLNPGAGKPNFEPTPRIEDPPAQPPAQPGFTPAAVAPRPLPAPIGPGAKTLTLKAARKSSWVALGSISAAVLVLLVGALLFFLFSGPDAIESRVVLERDNRESIHLTCSSCDDGTRARIGSAESTFRAQQASVAAPKNLKVGSNPLTLELTPPNTSRTTKVPLDVRIDYRVRADLTALEGLTPELRVIVEAVPGSTVSVDQRPVPLGNSNQAIANIDVSADLTGQDSTVRRFERTISYAVVPPGGKNQVGQIVVQLGIAPLVIDAPGETITVEGPTFVLAGRTARGGAVSVEGRPLRVDPEGRFAQVMNVSSVGETTIRVRAALRDHAPRLFPIRVRRVESFAREAAKLRAQATTSYASIAESTDTKKGWPLALEGSVLDRSNLEYTTLFLLDVASGCAAAPCLARVVHGAKLDLAQGQRVSVFGRLQGSVDGPRKGTKIPEVLADFVVKGK